MNQFSLPVTFDIGTMRESVEIVLRSLDISKKVIIIDSLVHRKLRNKLFFYSSQNALLVAKLNRTHRAICHYAYTCGLDNDLQSLGIPICNVSQYIINLMFKQTLVHGTLQQIKNIVHSKLLMSHLHRLSFMGICAMESLFYSLQEHFSLFLKNHPILANTISLNDYKYRLMHICSAISAGVGWLLEDDSNIYILLRPQIGLDDQLRIHCEECPAISFQDGLQEYFWHGVKVPREVIMEPQSLGPKRILSEPNIEVRRVMIDKYGLDTLFAQTMPKKIDSDFDYGGKRELLFLQNTGDEPIMIVKVTCPSTSRCYTLRVPPTMTSSAEAIAWTFGYEKVDNYTPLVET